MAFLYLLKFVIPAKISKFVAPHVYSLQCGILFFAIQ